jgi:DNA-binding NtrC family response regulator
VEDDAHVRAVLRDLLQRWFPAASILEAADGASGSAILEREDVDLILSDQRMPGTDGVTFLARCRKLRPAARRVLITGHVEWSTAMRAVNEGHVHALYQKPLDTLRFMDDVAKLLAEPPEPDLSSIARTLHGARALRSIPVPFRGPLGGQP